LQKAAISFVLSVCLSIYPSECNYSAPTGWIFMKFDIWVFLKNMSKNQISFKSDKNNRYSLWRCMYMYDSISLHSFFLESEIFQTGNVDKIKTHILCSIAFFLNNHCHLWYNVDKYGRSRQATDDNIIQQMHCAWWITKATDSHQVQAILITFTRLQRLCKHTSMLCYTKNAYLRCTWKVAQVFHLALSLPLCMVYGACFPSTTHKKFIPLITVPIKSL
jgi:hypothetical protein